MKTLNLVLVALALSFTISAQTLEITCPANIFQGTDPGVCTAVVNELTPEISADNPIAAVLWAWQTIDPSNGVGVVYQSDLCGINDISGNTFVGNLSGISTITYTVIDIFANVEFCTFTVDIDDAEAPTFDIFDPCDTDLFPGSVDCIFPSLEDVPLLWGPPYPDIADMVFETMLDNCLPSDASIPPWYSATMSSGVLEQGEDFITYTFTAYDDEFNAETKQMTFYFEANPLGIQVHYALNLEVYPNPSNGMFTCNEEYEIFTLKGQSASEPLSSGTYILKGESGRVTRIIIQ